MFGPLSVQTGERSLGPGDFGGLKPKQVFEILLLARGGLVNKEVLAEALWPDKPPQNVPATIETYVSVLRSRLCPDRDTGRRLVITLPGAYRLDAQQLSVDAWRFDDLIAQAERIDGPERVLLLSEAVSLVRGELLEDAPYAEWAQRDRRRYQELAVRANIQIATDALVIGDPVTALRHAEAALRIEPLEEAAWQAVMRSHHSLGHGDAAKRALDQCRRLLQSELGVDPTAETLAAAGAADGRSGAPVDLRLTVSGPTSVRSPGVGADRRSGGHHLPFLGREQEIDHVLHAVERSQAGRFELVVIDGRSGIGRTALLDQVHQRLACDVGRYAYAQHDLEMPSPPLAVALRNAVSAAAADAVQRYAAYEEPADPADRWQYLDRLLRANTATVLLLDDLHWADAETLAMIEALAAGSADLPVTVVATVRRDVPRFAEVVEALPSASWLQLGPLNEAALGHLRPEHRHLMQIAGGHPGVMADHYRWVSSGHSGYSPSLSGAVKRQISELGPELSELLRAAAALSEPFESFDLVDALGRSIADVTQQLLQALHLGLLELYDGGLRFREPAVRAILNTTIAPDRRRRIAQSRQVSSRRLTDSDLASIAAARDRRTVRQQAVPRSRTPLGGPISPAEG